MRKIIGCTLTAIPFVAIFGLMFFIDLVATIVALSAAAMIGFGTYLIVFDGKKEAPDVK